MANFSYVFLVSYMLTAAKIKTLLSQAIKDNFILEVIFSSTQIAQN